MDRFCIKLVTSGLDKYANLSKQTHQLTMESVHYESVVFIVQAPELLINNRLCCKDLPRTNALAYIKICKLRV
jgi:hypothetical protein